MAYKFQYSHIWQKIVLIHVCLFDHGQKAAATYKLLWFVSLEKDTPFASSGRKV